MKPVFVALTDAGRVIAERAAEAIGGEVHIAAAAIGGTFSHRERVVAKRPDEAEGDDLTRRASSGLPLSRPSDKSEDHPLPPGERVPVHVFNDLSQHLRMLFAEGRPIAGICAAGILIRLLAPLLGDKRVEPPVVALSEDGRSVVPLLGGHRGANDLARRLAEALGGHAAITTAGDARFGVALDAPPAGWTLANPEDAKSAMAALLSGAKARLEGEAPWLAESGIPFADDGTVRLVATTSSSVPLTRPSADAEGRPLPQGERALSLVYRPRRLAVGVGCERDADAAEAIGLVERALAEAGLAQDSVAVVASIDLKADEPAVLQAAERLGVPVRFFTATALEAETPRLKNPSETVFREVGAHGVAEAAALAAAGADATLVVAKTKSARVTCAIAEAPQVIDAAKVGRARGRLAIVGIGPGSAEWLTPEAKRLLQTSDVVVGYSLYLDLVAPLIARAERFDSPLGAEEVRVRKALELAGEGRSVALVSSGDAGIYALATLAFACLDDERTFSRNPDVSGLLVESPEIGNTRFHGEKVAAERSNEGMRGDEAPASFGGTLSPWERIGAASRIEIVVAPGVSAMQAAAAKAGAPLGHDFCAISLSDLLTPWETIEARIRAAAEGDFVVAFYNPVSQRRRTQLADAKRILLQHRPPDTPVVLAKNLGRDGESVTSVALADLSVEGVDMLTLVLVGASTTRQVKAGGRAWTYTPRGYEKKRISPPLRGRDGEGGRTQRKLVSPLPGPPPQGGRE